MASEEYPVHFAEDGIEGAIVRTGCMSRAAAHPKADRLSEAEMDRRAEVCRKLLVTAGQLAMEGYARQGAVQPVAMKGPQDFLTETDGKVEEHIRATLAEAFPQDGFLGEEGGGIGSARMWVVDPIDGTANFMRGIPHFCISIAFVEDGRSEIGGIANPAVGETYFARRGQGATRNGAPIHVSPTQAFDRAFVEFGWSPRIPNRDYLDKVSLVWALGANVRRSGSGALGLAYVADGRSDAYAELHINSWDCLAGLLLVEEAGGRVNRFLDGDGMAKGNPVLAAAPGVAATLSQVIGVPLDDG
ncbi:inositol phosphatase [Mesorhizobium sp. L103C105A0]|nr:inositol phosphatase [Mesorhizobium sp. L103C105A0]